MNDLPKAPKASLAPAIAYGKRSIYHEGLGDNIPLDGDDLYRDYKFLGRYKVGASETEKEMKARAQAEFGPAAKVFWTPRFWVAYAVL